MDRHTPFVAIVAGIAALSVSLATFGLVVVVIAVGMIVSRIGGNEPTDSNQTPVKQAKTMTESHPNPTIPNRFDRNKHTRRAAKFGYHKGLSAGRMLNVADLQEMADTPAAPPEFSHDIDEQNWCRIGHWYATESHDIGGIDGVRVMNRLERIAADGATLSRFTENGDSCMFPVHSGYTSGIAAGQCDLLDDCIEAYDRGFAVAFAESIDD